MEILIDIGNTNTGIAFGCPSGLVENRFYIRTSREEIKPASLQRLFAPYLNKINSVTVVSVVPVFLSMLRDNMERILPDVPVKVVGKDVKVPIEVRYKDPDEVGQDRLVTAFAVFSKYGGPVIAIDFGTAVTFDVINRNGAYMGGLIFPGLRLAMKSLSMGTALLPEIALIPSSGVIGRDTRSSMNNGILFGYAAVCDGLVSKLRKRYRKKVKVVATGGDAALVSRYARNIEYVEPDIIFHGLSMLSRIGPVP